MAEQVVDHITVMLRIRYGGPLSAGEAHTLAQIAYEELIYVGLLPYARAYAAGWNDCADDIANDLEAANPDLDHYNAAMPKACGPHRRTTERSTTMTPPATQIADQPPPVPNDQPAIQDLVITDIEERKAIGLERYGVLVQAHNGRDALVDAYQEAMDLTIYLRQFIEEHALVNAVVTAAKAWSDRIVNERIAFTPREADLVAAVDALIAAGGTR